MSVSPLLKMLPGFRLVDGTLINQIIDNVNTMSSNGTARNLVEAPLALSVTAVTNTDSTLAIPSGAIIRSMTVYTTTAFTAVTDAMISVGSAAGGAQYVAAVSIKAVGIVSLTLIGSNAAALANFTAGTLFVRVAQSGGSTAVGNATLVVSYAVPA